ncbi:TonB-dependent receptor [Portibacter lacus]|uniref:TonB-dependent receptor n=1 Tax=Portibacter lacus TaxID=1099794 RepID=UPI001F263799|nr:TonB-dependent receptor [Portibacter lacus]
MTILNGQFSVGGKVLDNVNQPLVGIEIYDAEESLLAETDVYGKFLIEFVTKGKKTLTFTSSYFQSKTIIVDATDLEMEIELLPVVGSIEETDFQVVSLSDDEVNEGGSSQNVSSLLQASNDVFVNNTTFQFNVARFSARGYGNGDTRMMLNGMPVNDLDDGRVNWSYWGGLNDVLRNRQTKYGLGDIEYSFGGIGGAQDVDLRASYQRVQIRPSFAISNRSYTKRAMFTYSSGVKDNKYAFSASASRRWGNEGFVDATFYDAWSYFLSFDYFLDKKNKINIVALGAPTQRGRGGASTQELYDIAGSNYYNSYWGYQNGEKRNSRTYNSFQPIFMLRHDLELNKKFTLATTVAFQTGYFGSSRLDWYNVADPRPDYYRNLPSFYKDSPEIAAYITDQLSIEENRQIDWDHLYFINKNTTEDFIDNDGNVVASGHRAKYLMGEQRFDAQKLTFNSNYKYNATDNITLNGGLTALQEVNHNFQTAQDLLGADYYIDIDKFAERDFAPNSDELQNDLNSPNRVIGVGDTYGFDYNNTTQQASFWSQALLKTNNIDAFIGGEVSYTQFYREGFMRNGKFPDNSYGKSETLAFTNYGAKAGISYKIDGRNYVNLMGNYQTKAPYTRFAFISPRTRHDVVPNLQSSKVLSTELTYNHNSPLFKAKVSGYYTTIKDQTEVYSFYHDELNGFVNFILTDIDQQHMGVEIAGDLKLSTTLSVVAAASLGDYIYTSRPSATISQDNNAELLEEDQTIYQKDFYVPNTPQQAYTVGLKYNSSKYWFVNVNFNYFDKIFLDFNPTRRTEDAVADLVKTDNEVLWESILFQEQLPSNYTVDIFGGKSWRIGQKFIYLTIGVNNVLNNQNFRIGGYEQNRFDFENKDVNRFPSRYFYAYGANYFIGLSFRL